jgi:hypothetical protein
MRSVPHSASPFARATRSPAAPSAFAATDATLQITGFGPIAEQRRPIEQRIAPRSHVQIDQGHRAEIRRVEDEIVELVALRLDAASCLISSTEGIRHVPAIKFLAREHWVHRVADHPFKTEVA